MLDEIQAFEEYLRDVKKNIKKYSDLLQKRFDADGRIFKGTGDYRSR